MQLVERAYQYHKSKDNASAEKKSARNVENGTHIVLAVDGSSAKTVLIKVEKIRNGIMLSISRPSA